MDNLTARKYVQGEARSQAVVFPQVLEMRAFHGSHIVLTPFLHDISF